MKTIIPILGILILVSGCATVYQAPELDRRERSHKQIAILPIESVIKYNKLPEDVSVDQIHEMENEMKYIFQEQLYVRFLKKSSEYRVNFQDIDETNTIFEKHGINANNISEYTKEELATVLNVDAIISGKILTTKPMTTGAAIAVGVVFGVWGPTNQADVTLSVHDGKDSQLMWKYNHTYSGSLGSTPENLTKALMKSIARKFPYQRN